MIDTFLEGLEFVKFTIDDALAKNPNLYFINTQTHRAHMMFARVAGLPRGGWEQMKGVLVYRPRLQAPNGTPGLYTFEFEPFDEYPFEMVKLVQTMLVEKMPILRGKIGYYPRQQGIDVYREEQTTYAKSDIKVYLEQDLTDATIAYLPLNQNESFGRLRRWSGTGLPNARDIVICDVLPNEMPRVAGIITTVRQTPLSHVNLRAIQDRVPNAFIAKAADLPDVRLLLGKLVFYRVTPDGYELRLARSHEVETFYEHRRPLKALTPPRDLAAREILALDRIDFQDSDKFGVKAANLATLRSFDFSDGVVPSGFAIPFRFYDQFMKHNGFYELVEMLLHNEEFRRNKEVQKKELKKLRSLIKKGKMPKWMIDALTEVQLSFPRGTSIRCRSSTNNEDLPSFNGAGLYDSFTHHPDEGHLAKSVKQVFASLWNFRAFEEREHYRVDHDRTAMAVLLHANYRDELANGVAVTDDILYETYGNYYLNTQVGEDLVTNPERRSTPEEVLLGWYEDDGYQVLRPSNQVPRGDTLLNHHQLGELRDCLATIHSRFRKLYKRTEDEQFAMEIEYKITKHGKLAIKQARPWVFGNQVDRIQQN